MLKEKLDNKIIAIPSERIVGRIFLIRGKKVMIDRDLAELYGVETKMLKRQVNRNIDRFPEDFMFEMSDAEFADWRCQFGTSNYSDKMGLRYMPYVFTEQGVAMLSSILRSPRAIQVNIQIIRAFTRLKELAANNKLIWEKIEAMEAKHDKDIREIFEVLRSLLIQEEKPKKEEIGFKL